MKTSFAMSFEGGGSTFDEFPREEVASILAVISKAVSDGRDGGDVKDINGNVIGHWHFETEKEDE